MSLFYFLLRRRLLVLNGTERAELHFGVFVNDFVLHSADDLQPLPVLDFAVFLFVLQLVQQRSLFRIHQIFFLPPHSVAPVEGQPMIDLERLGVHGHERLIFLQLDFHRRRQLSRLHDSLLEVQFDVLQLPPQCELFQVVPRESKRLQRFAFDFQLGQWLHVQGSQQVIAECIDSRFHLHFVFVEGLDFDVVDLGLLHHQLLLLHALPGGLADELPLQYLVAFVADVRAQEHVNEDDENLAFELGVDFDFLEEVVAEGGDDFDEVNQGEFEVEGFAPSSLCAHLIVLLLQLESQCADLHVLLAFGSRHETLEFLQTGVEDDFVEEGRVDGFEEECGVLERAVEFGVLLGGEPVADVIGETGEEDDFFGGVFHHSSLLYNPIIEYKLYG